MIEEISLPDDAVILGKEAFPIAHGLAHPRLIWKIENQVDVIGHQDGEGAIPDSPFIAVSDGFDNRMTRVRMAKRVLAAVPRANRDEKGR